MPPKQQRRPPPLPKSLFTSGALAPGSAPLPPSPSTLHPSSIIDASYSPSSGRVNSITSTPLISVIPSHPESTLSLDSNIKQLPPFQQITYTSPPPSFSSTLSAKPIQLNLPLDLKLVTESQYDELESFVARLSGLSSVGDELEGMMKGMGKKEARLGENGGGQGVKREVIISSFLPPPLSPTHPSSKLLPSSQYNTYIAHLSTLSLFANVSLLLLPPVLGSLVGEKIGDGGVEGGEEGEGWWKDRGEVERVLRMYISSALECFGTHRLIFGTSHPLLTSTNTQIIPSAEWYPLCRKIVSELVAGEGLEEGRKGLEGIFRGNVGRLLGGAARETEVVGGSRVAV